MYSFAAAWYSPGLVALGNPTAHTGASAALSGHNGGRSIDLRYRSGRAAAGVTVGIEVAAGLGLAVGASGVGATGVGGAAVPDWVGVRVGVAVAGVEVSAALAVGVAVFGAAVFRAAVAVTDGATVPVDIGTRVGEGDAPSTGALIGGLAGALVQPSTTAAKRSPIVLLAMIAVTKAGSSPDHGRPPRAGRLRIGRPWRDARSASRGCWSQWQVEVRQAVP
jgi:hypothetical protein